jgi:hypothetical protein
LGWYVTPKINIKPPITIISVRDPKVSSSSVVTNDIAIRILHEFIKSICAEDCFTRIQNGISETIEFITGPTLSSNKEEMGQYKYDKQHFPDLRSVHSLSRGAFI